MLMAPDGIIHFLIFNFTYCADVDQVGDELPNVTSNYATTTLHDDPLDEIQSHIDEIAKSQSISSGDIEQEIQLYWATDFKMKLKDFNSKEFWNRRKTKYPSVYALHCLCNSVPATQVSVERMFSHLRYILTDQKSKMCTELLDAIVLLKCNKVFD